jgi:hypothetical protein
MHSSSLPCYMPCPSHPPLLDHLNYRPIWRRVQLWSSSLCCSLQAPIISLLLVQNILLSSLFSKTLKNPQSTFFPSFKTTQITDKIIVLYILIFAFYIAHEKREGSDLNSNQRSWESSETHKYLLRKKRSYLVLKDVVHTATIVPWPRHSWSG